MKARNKAFLTIASMFLLVVASMSATYAYLTSSDTAVNTFTVGKVKITLDEAKVDENGDVIADADRVQENAYHFIPGNVYVKDPTIHVDIDSENAYIAAQVTINTNLKDTKLWHGDDDGYVGIHEFVEGGVASAKPTEENAALEKISYTADETEKEIFVDKTLISKVTETIYGDVYIVQDYSSDKTTFTYFFENAQAAKSDIVLFEKLNIDGTWTNEDLAKLVKVNPSSQQSEFVMNVNAYAVQAEGFSNVFDAYEKAFPELLQ